MKEHRILSGHLCECGCGQKTYYAEITANRRKQIKGVPLKFVSGHTSRGQGPGANLPGNTSWCADCSKVKDKTHFYKNKTLKSGIHSYCKLCCKRRTKEQRIKGNIKAYLKYGLSHKDYANMIEEQKSLCKICKNPETLLNGDKPFTLSVDHCHTTNKVRGLLCKKCNSLIAFANDNPEILKSAICYLEKSIST